VINGAPAWEPAQHNTTVLRSRVALTALRLAASLPADEII